MNVKKPKIQKMITLKKLEETKNVLVDQEKNLNIVTEMFNYIFLNASNAFDLAFS